MSDKYNPERGLSRTLPALALTRAGGNTKPAPAPVYLLADHLDTVLAAAEDIVNARLTWNRAQRAGQLEISAEKHNTRDDIEEIRKLENTIIIRVLKSRERAEDVARADKRFRQLAKLYVAGTAVLLDAVEECGDSTDIDFATADTIPAYLRSRGLVDPDAPAPAIGEDLQVGEDFLIAKRIAAGPLMDLAAALLDALELHYDLFLDEDELAMAPQINRFEDDDLSEPDLDGGAERGAQVKDAALEAAIEDVRGEVLKQDDTSTEPALWAKMSTAGSVVPPVVSPPVSDPLVVVSTTGTAHTDELSQSSDDDDMDSDAVPSLSVSAPVADPVPLSELDDEVANAIIENADSEDPDPESVPSLAVSAPLADPIAISSKDDEEADSKAVHAEETLSEDEVPTEIVFLRRSASVETSETDVDEIAAEPDAETTPETSLERAADLHQDEGDQHADPDVDISADDVSDETANDDLVIIQAANDDETCLDDDQREDQDVTLVADNSDGAPDTVEARDDTDDNVLDSDSDHKDTLSDEVTEDANSAAEDDGMIAAETIAPEQDCDDAGDSDDAGKKKKRKPKSLLGRLSLIKS